MTGPFKDHFSKQSPGYSSYRPGYPAELFDYLAAMAPSMERAWDCATGTGQAAAGLAQHFRKVIATDASATQIANAAPKAGVIFQVAAAEDTAIDPGSVDLVVVAQALHWFDRDAFYAELRRVLKPRGVIAVWCYNLLKVAPQIDAAINELYTEIVGAHWPPERQLVETGYATVDFPFYELSPPAFQMTANWSLEHLVGYLHTWSAVQRYKDTQGADPVKRVYHRLRQAWGDAELIRSTSWPLSLRVGLFSDRT